MKNLVILGTARAGKSYLSKNVVGELSKNNHVVTLLPGDPLLGAVHKFSRNLLWKLGFRKIVHAVPWFERIHKKRLRKKFLGFSLYFIDHIEKDVIIVFEGVQIKPDEAVKIFDKNKYKLVIVGYPNISVEQKIKEIRQFDKHSYISNKSDKELSSMFSAHITESKQYYEFAKKHNITFLDTSKNYQKTIKEFAKNICDFLK